MRNDIDDTIICELCSRGFSEDLFYQHLSRHTIAEVELLKKLSEQTMNMTSEEYKDFFRRLEIESYQQAQQSLSEKSAKEQNA